MFIILAVVTFIGLVLISRYFMSPVVEQGAEEQRESVPEPAADEQPITVHPSHSWVRPRGDELTAIGMDAFAADFAGELATIELPSVGAELEQGQTAWTAVSRTGRRLPMAAPVGGQVVAVNEDLAREPDLVQRSPYRVGWVALLKPRNLRAALANLPTAEQAAALLELAKSKVVAGTGGEALGAVAADGGVLVRAFGDELADDSWEELRLQLFKEPAPAPQLPPGDQAK